MATQASVDLSGLFRKLDVLSNTVHDEGIKLVEQVAEIGAATARFSLDAAVTDYGNYRMSIGRGNSAGRNDTGDMIYELNAFSAKVNPSGPEASFGWRFPKKYFEIQEEGFDKFATKIKGAHSLLDGQLAANNELPRLERNMKARISRKMKGK